MALPVAAIVSIVLACWVILVLGVFGIFQFLKYRGKIRCDCRPCGDENSNCCGCCRSISEACNCCNPSLDACLNSCCPKKKISAVDILLCQCCAEPGQESCVLSIWFCFLWCWWCACCFPDGDEEFYCTRCCDSLLVCCDDNCGNGCEFVCKCLSCHWKDPWPPKEPCSCRCKYLKDLCEYPAFQCELCYYRCKECMRRPCYCPLMPCGPIKCPECKCPKCPAFAGCPCSCASMFAALQGRDFVGSVKKLFICNCKEACSCCKCKDCCKCRDCCKCKDWCKCKDCCQCKDWCKCKDCCQCKDWCKCKDCCQCKDWCQKCKSMKCECSCAKCCNKCCDVCCFCFPFEREEGVSTWKSVAGKLFGKKENGDINCDCSCSSLKKCCSCYSLKKCCSCSSLKKCCSSCSLKKCCNKCCDLCNKVCELCSKCCAMCCFCFSLDPEEGKAGWRQLFGQQPDEDLCNCSNCNCDKGWHGLKCPSIVLPAWDELGENFVLSLGWTEGGICWCYTCTGCATPPCRIPKGPMCEIYCNKSFLELGKQREEDVEEIKKRRERNKIRPDYICCFNFGDHCFNDICVNHLFCKWDGYRGYVFNLDNIRCKCTCVKHNWFNYLCQGLWHCFCIDIKYVSKLFSFVCCHILALVYGILSSLAYCFLNVFHGILTFMFLKCSSQTFQDCVCLCVICRNLKIVQPTPSLMEMDFEYGTKLEQEKQERDAAHSCTCCKCKYLLYAGHYRGFCCESPSPPVIIGENPVVLTQPVTINAFGQVDSLGDVSYVDRQSFTGQSFTGQTFSSQALAAGPDNLYTVVNEEDGSEIRKYHHRGSVVSDDMPIVFRQPKSTHERRRSSLQHRKMVRDDDGSGVHLSDVVETQECSDGELSDDGVMGSDDSRRVRRSELRDRWQSVAGQALADGSRRSEIRDRWQSVAGQALAAGADDLYTVVKDEDGSEIRRYHHRGSIISDDRPIVFRQPKSARERRRDSFVHRKIVSVDDGTGAQLSDVIETQECSAGELSEIDDGVMGLDESRRSRRSDLRDRWEDSQTNMRERYDGRASSLSRGARSRSVSVSPDRRGTPRSGSLTRHDLDGSKLSDTRKKSMALYGRKSSSFSPGRRRESYTPGRRRDESLVNERYGSVLDKSDSSSEDDYPRPLRRSKAPKEYGTTRQSHKKRQSTSRSPSTRRRSSSKSRRKESEERHDRDRKRSVSRDKGRRGIGISGIQVVDRDPLWDSSTEAEYPHPDRPGSRTPDGVTPLSIRPARLSLQNHTPARGTGRPKSPTDHRGGRSSSRNRYDNYIGKIIRVTQEIEETPERVRKKSATSKRVKEYAETLKRVKKYPEPSKRVKEYPETPKRVKEYPETPKHVKEYSETPKRIKEYPETSKRVKEYPETSKRVKEYPETSKRVKEYPETPKRVKEYPETSKRVKEYPETSKRIMEYPETSKRVKEYPETSKRITEYPETSKRVKEYPETSKRVKEYPETSKRVKEYPETPKAPHTGSTQKKLYYRYDEENEETERQPSARKKSHDRHDSKEEKKSDGRRRSKSGTRDHKDDVKHEVKRHSKTGTQDNKDEEKHEVRKHSRTFDRSIEEAKDEAKRRKSLGRTPEPQELVRELHRRFSEPPKTAKEADTPTDDWSTTRIPMEPDDLEVKHKKSRRRFSEPPKTAKEADTPTDDWSTTRIPMEPDDLEVKHKKSRRRFSEPPKTDTSTDDLGTSRRLSISDRMKTLRQKRHSQAAGVEDRKEDAKAAKKRSVSQARKPSVVVWEENEVKTKEHTTRSKQKVRSSKKRGSDSEAEVGYRNKRPRKQESASSESVTSTERVRVRRPSQGRRRSDTRRRPPHNGAESSLSSDNVRAKKHPQTVRRNTLSSGVYESSARADIARERPLSKSMPPKRSRGPVVHEYITSSSDTLEMDESDSAHNIRPQSAKSSGKRVHLEQFQGFTRSNSQRGTRKKSVDRSHVQQPEDQTQTRQPTAAWQSDYSDGDSSDTMYGPASSESMSEVEVHKPVYGRRN